MNIYLLRHGEAGDAWAENDHLRPLTDTGKAMMTRQAEALIRWKTPIDTILSSPFIRAHQTADLVAQALGLKVIEEDMISSGQFGMPELERLTQKYRESQHLMLVGHEPDFSETLSRLVGGGLHKVKKGGLARIEITFQKPLKGQLIWLLTPDVMGA